LSATHPIKKRGERTEVKRSVSGDLLVAAAVVSSAPHSGCWLQRWLQSVTGTEPLKVPQATAAAADVHFQP
jgi:hypothetical protein